LMFGGKRFLFSSLLRELNVLHMFGTKKNLDVSRFGTKKSSSGTNTIVRNFNEKVEIEGFLKIQILEIFMAATVERRNLKSMFYVCL
jgi:hypothetical protein